MNITSHVNMNDNRQPRARLVILVSRSDDSSEKLRNLLEFPIEVEDTEEVIRTFAHELKNTVWFQLCSKGSCHGSSRQWMQAGGNKITS